MKDWPQILELFELTGYAHRELFESIKHPWEALDKIASYLKEFSLGTHKGKISEQAYLIDPKLISIGAGSVIEPGAYIKGPCIIGKNCTVRHGAYIRGDVIVGDNCVIGHDTEIKNSILLNHAHAAHFAYVGDSILGNHVNLGAGAKLANLLFNNKQIKISNAHLEINTHRRKLGAIIGDRAQIGCNAVTNPGTIIGKGSCVYPCVCVGGVIAADKIVKGNQEVVSLPQKNYAFS